ncbi:MAG TPA: hypothetical protein VF576_01045 [Rubricoccaceae bacterium]|jgi:hypothetical protein
MRLSLCVLSLAALSGCDSGNDLGPVDGVVLVSLADDAEGGAAVRLVTEDEYPCGTSLVVTVAGRGTDLRATVEGTHSIDPAIIDCAAPTSPAVGFAPFPDDFASSELNVVVEHRGAADRYRYSCGIVDCGFYAVETSTTRLETP